MSTILVVEDEPVLAVALEISLQRAGYTVLGPMAHLDTAMAALTGPSIDAALLDVHLSRGETVYPVADRLEEMHVPFGFMTAYRTDFIASRYPAHPIVRKPCSETDLLQLVKELMSAPAMATDSPLVRRGDPAQGPAISCAEVVALQPAPTRKPTPRWKLDHAIALGLGIGIIAGILTALM
jgi:CheY-like chemotaxis protein